MHAKRIILAELYRLRRVGPLPCRSSATEMESKMEPVTITLFGCSYQHGLSAVV
jgi:hypothetical protein